MPSHKYFEELTRAVLTDVDQVKGFSQRQSAEQIEQLSQDISEWIAGAFAQSLDAEMEDAGQRTAFQERLAEVRQATEAADAAEGDHALQQLEAWLQQTLPFYCCQPGGAQWHGI
jgi:hypothetical protein